MPVRRTRTPPDVLVGVDKIGISAQKINSKLENEGYGIVGEIRLYFYK